MKRAAAAKQKKHMLLPKQPTTNQPKKPHQKNHTKKRRRLLFHYVLGFYFLEIELKLLYTPCADCGSHHSFLGREGDVLFASMNNGY